MLAIRRLRPAVLSAAFAAMLSIEAPAAPAPHPGDEWSPGYKEQLRRTVERRKERRRAHGQARGGRLREGQGVGTIVPYLMPPSLIIRQTPEVHDEIGDLLRLLRGC